MKLDRWPPKEKDSLLYLFHLPAIHSFLKNGPNLASFSFIDVFSKTYYKFYNKLIYEKISIPYMVPGFELTTYGT